MVLTFFKDAFTIDEGEPRYYKDAANQGFLDEVNKGVVPRELQQQYGEELDVELIEKQGEEWKSQPKKFKAFTSGGNTLSCGLTLPTSITFGRISPFIVQGPIQPFCGDPGSAAPHHSRLLSAHHHDPGIPFPSVHLTSVRFDFTMGVVSS